MSRPSGRSATGSRGRTISSIRSTSACSTTSRPGRSLIRRLRPKTGQLLGRELAIKLLLEKIAGGLVVAHRLAREGRVQRLLRQGKVCRVVAVLVFLAHRGQHQELGPLEQSKFLVRAHE